MFWQLLGGIRSLLLGCTWTRCMIHQCQRHFLFQKCWFKEQHKSDFISSVMNITAGECVQHGGTFCLCCSLITTTQCSIPCSTEFSGTLNHPFSCFAFNLNIQVSVPQRDLFRSAGRAVLPKCPQHHKIRYIFFPFSILSLFSSVFQQLNANWTLVMLVCCWLREEAPTHWLTCKSSKVGLCLGF